jgi:hypothetical protein
VLSEKHDFSFNAARENGRHSAVQNMHLILTACTMRKRLSPDPALLARSLQSASLEQVSHDWKRRVKLARPVAKARDLYCGRSIYEALNVARDTKSKLTIVSAGLGLIDADAEIPSYNLTVAPGSPDCVLDRTTPRQSAESWWREIANQDSILQSLSHVEHDVKAILFVALPQTYLSMVAPALEALPSQSFKRVRLITASNRTSMSLRLAEQRLPYDERLDGPDSPIQGTLSDFASRALRHFTESILHEFPGASIEEHANQVQQSLSRWRHPERKAGARLNDDEILGLLREHWAAHLGQSSRLLRLFRDQLGIACEQKRFARLATTIRNERKAA